MRWFRRFFPFEYRNVWRPVSPIAAHSSPGDDVHVEVWCVLSCNDTVILNEIQAFRIVRSDESVGHPSHGPHDGDCLVVRQIKESWGVTSGDDVDLPMLKLLPVDHCHSLLGLLDDSLVLASGNCLAQETWIVRSRCRAPSRASGIGRYLNRQYGFLSDTSGRRRVRDRQAGVGWERYAPLTSRLRMRSANVSSREKAQPCESR